MQNTSHKFPISVFIIAKNEADRIGHTISSVIDWVDEVLVIDSGSSDETARVAEQLGARVIYNEWMGYGPQKVFGEAKCRNNWILNLDADEEVSPELKREIIEEAKNTASFGRPAAFSVDCAMMLPGEVRPKKFAVKTRTIRLYDKSRAGFRDSKIHDSVTVSSGETLHMNGLVYHRSFRSYAHEVDKINFYTSMQAQDFLRRNRRPTALRIICEPFFAFFKAYIIRRYALYGVDGFIQSCIYSFAKTLRLAKAREIFSRKN